MRFVDLDIISSHHNINTKTTLSENKILTVVANAELEITPGTVTSVEIIRSHVSVALVGRVGIDGDRRLTVATGSFCSTTLVSVNLKIGPVQWSQSSCLVVSVESTNTSSVNGFAAERKEKRSVQNELHC